MQQFFIGDDSSEYVNGHVNVVVEPLPDGTGDPRSILLDSGADASVFPLESARSGTVSSAAKMKVARCPRERNSCHLHERFGHVFV